MSQLQDPSWLKPVGRMLGGTILVGAVLMGFHIARVSFQFPRTNDAMVTANVVGMSPHVSGALIELNVKDNQEVNAGDLLFTIDPRPYQAAAARANGAWLLAQSELQAMSNSITAAVSAVKVRQAELDLATSDFNRDTQLLKEQVIDPLTMDTIRTRQRMAQAQLEEAQQNLLQQQNLLGQSGSLNARISMAEADLRAAQINLDYCYVRAPFPGRVANLNISVGQFARVGEPIFVLVDTRRWYVVANFRETFLPSIQPGQAVEVYLMPYPDRRFRGTVEGVGWAIQTEDAAPNGTLMGVKPTLNWVRLAQRIPVRIQLESADQQNPYRMGMTAVVTVRPTTAPPQTTINREAL